MTEFDRQNADFFPAIHANHRRSSTTQTIGYIVTGEQADKIRCCMDAQARKGDAMTLVLLSVQLFVLVVSGAVALA